MVRWRRRFPGLLRPLILLMFLLALVLVTQGSDARELLSVSRLAGPQG